MWYSPEHLAAFTFSSILLLAPTMRPFDGASAVRTTACDAPAPTLPASVQLQRGLEPVVRRTLEHSPTFRRQCRIVASARALTVTVGVAVRPVGVTRRARAEFRDTASGGIAAAIEIYSGGDLPELLGHEFEHLIEQLDGIDLARAARAGLAVQMEDGAFETARAQAAGLRVAGEVADHAPDSLRRAGGRIWRALRRLM